MFINIIFQDDYQLQPTLIKVTISFRCIPLLGKPYALMQNVISVTTLRHQYDVIVVTVTFMTTVVEEHGRQCMSCPAKISMALQTEILSTETSDLLKQNGFSLVIQFSICQLLDLVCSSVSLLFLLLNVDLVSDQ